eukprot:762913-Hanusia_phi.AAC.2
MLMLQVFPLLAPPTFLTAFFLSATVPLVRSVAEFHSNWFIEYRMRASMETNDSSFLDLQMVEKKESKRRRVMDSREQKRREGKRRGDRRGGEGRGEERREEEKRRGEICEWWGLIRGGRAGECT